MQELEELFKIINEKFIRQALDRDPAILFTANVICNLIDSEVELGNNEKNSKQTLDLIETEFLKHVELLFELFTDSELRKNNFYFYLLDLIQTLLTLDKIQQRFIEKNIVQTTVEILLVEENSTTTLYCFKIIKQLSEKISVQKMLIELNKFDKIIEKFNFIANGSADCISNQSSETKLSSENAPPGELNQNKTTAIFQEKLIQSGAISSILLYVQKQNQINPAFTSDLLEFLEWLIESRINDTTILNQFYKFIIESNYQEYSISTQFDILNILEMTLKSSDQNCSLFDSQFNGTEFIMMHLTIILGENQDQNILILDDNSVSLKLLNILVLLTVNFKVCDNLFENSKLLNTVISWLDLSNHSFCSSASLILGNICNSREKSQFFSTKNIFPKIIRNVRKTASDQDKFKTDAQLSTHILAHLSLLKNITVPVDCRTIFLEKVKSEQFIEMIEELFFINNIFLHTKCMYLMEIFSNKNPKMATAVVDSKIIMDALSDYILSENKFLSTPVECYKLYLVLAVFCPKIVKDKSHEYYSVSHFNMLTSENNRSKLMKILPDFLNLLMIIFFNEYREVTENVIKSNIFPFLVELVVNLSSDLQVAIYVLNIFNKALSLNYIKDTIGGHIFKPELVEYVRNMEAKSQNESVKAILTNYIQAYESNK